MKIVKEMPQDGQFIEVWIYAGCIWSTILKWEKGKLLEYERGGFNTWEEREPLCPECENFHFIVL